MKKQLFLILSLGLFMPAARSIEEAPELPSGLADKPAKEDPALPTGLKDESGPGGPELPTGLGEGDTETEVATGTETKTESFVEKLPFKFSGFSESRFGIRTGNDPYQKDFSIGEVRTHLNLQKYILNTHLQLAGDLVYDPVLDPSKIDLLTGTGFIDLRRANISFTPLDFMDVRLGRQIISWGTGDLLFLNDLFPKDWRSFFIGRDVDYLKAPSDAVRVSVFSDLINLDLVYNPRFNHDRYIDGRRISFWNQAMGRRSGRNHRIETVNRNQWFQDDETALRLFRNINGLELAAYGYHGFWKSPAGREPLSGKATFPRLAVYGASARRDILGGIANIETAYYHSLDDTSGDNPLVRNSELRFLIGYEREVAPDFTVGLQYYLEYIENYHQYRQSFRASPDQARDKDRHLLTMRLTWLLMRQNLELSLFNFYSPSDQDAYIRPRAAYQISDHWSVEGGGNIFTGRKSHTFFNQFANNSNIYLALRHYF